MGELEGLLVLFLGGLFIAYGPMLGMIFLANWSSGYETPKHYKVQFAIWFILMITGIVLMFINY